MPQYASPICPYHYLFDHASDECRYDYASGVSCAGANPDCLTFNYTYMRCDNGQSKVGETTVGRNPIGNEYVVTQGGHPWNFTTNPKGPCTQILPWLSPCASGSMPQLNLRKKCQDDSPWAGFFSDDPAGCEIEGYPVGCMYKRCLSPSGGVIDCLEVERNPITGLPTYDPPNFNWKKNAIWSFSVDWLNVGCFRTINCTGVQNFEYGSCGTGYTTEYLGCPGGFAQDSSVNGAYGTGASYPYMPADSDPRITFDHIPEISPFDCNLIPSTNYPVLTNLNFYEVLTPFMGFGKENRISGDTTTIAGCYEALVSTCPTDVDIGSEGADGGCEYTNKPYTCPEGYEFDPSLDLCARAGGAGLDLVRIAGDRLLVAYVDADGNLKVLRYADATSDTIEQTVLIDVAGSSEDINHPRLATLSDGSVHLICLKGGDVLLRVSKDQGQTWSEPEIVVSGNVQGLAYTVVQGTGTRLLMTAQGGKWKLRVGKLDASGAAHTWSDPVITGNAYNSVGPPAPKGELMPSSDGAVRYLYMEDTAHLRLDEAEKLAEDGTGAWDLLSRVGTNPLVPDHAYAAAAWHSPHDGHLVVVASDLSGGWSVYVGEQGDASTDWTWAKKSSLASSNNTLAGGLWRRGDGTYEFAFVNTSGNVQIIRCKALKTDATGTWS